MAYRFDGTDDDVRFSPGALDTYVMGPVTAAALVKRGATGSWDGVLTILDAAGGFSNVLADLIEWSDTNDLAFWNGRSGANNIDGTADSNHTDTTNFYVVAVTWGGASTAPKFHWKQLGAGSWSHVALADGTGADCLAIATADRIIVGTDPSGGDDLSGDVVWAGISKSNDADGTVETLDTTDFDDVVAYGFEWLIGFEASSSLTDRTGGGGNEVSRSGTTLVSDPAGWSWGGGGAATVVRSRLLAGGVG